MATLTFRYGDPIHENIQCLRESQRHEEALKAASNDLDKGSIFQTTTFLDYHKHMSKDKHTLGGGELLADFFAQRSLFSQSQRLAIFSHFGHILWINGAVWASSL